ncbi:MAG TPA: DUF2155 domain-containing protein [Phenylobacterium sp.]|jgi:hypothetical protein|uniref:DUF2155 domain-containing protein n=1 Tax=Phenylobacterium sp. TaxID=1871053 RepID=UPI002D543F68|nr:DUF2155 domain-containing protein [Phenylobacterium sp.]HZZ69939.1 DUF2155 domain-containing protein [Phenylobacterium sp.]
MPMPFRPPPTSILFRGSWLALIFVASAGLAMAQPAPQAPAASPAAPKAAAPAELSPPPDIPPPESAPAPPAAEKRAAPTPPPAEPKPAAAPVRRARYDVAVLEALDKVTAESLRFEAAVGHPVRYKTLVFTVKACERSAADEPIDDSIAYLTVDSQPRPEAGKPALAPRQAFKGWMYASSPSLHPLEHPVYAAWLITCRAAAPLSPPAASGPPAGAPATSAPARPAAPARAPASAPPPAG